MGAQTQNAMKMATRKRMEKPPSGEVTYRPVSEPSAVAGRYSCTGASRNWMSVGVAKYRMMAVVKSEATMMVNLRRSSPRWSIRGMRAGPIGMVVFHRCAG